MKLQSHKRFEMGGDPCRLSSPAHMQITGSTRAGCTESYPVRFLVSQRMETPQHFQTIYSNVWSPLQQKWGLCLNHRLHFVSIVSYPFTGHHWEEFTSIFISGTDSHWHIDSHISQPPWALSSPGLTGDHEIGFADIGLNNSAWAEAKEERNSEQRTACTDGSECQKQCCG